MNHDEILLLVRHLNLFFAPIMFLLALKDYRRGRGQAAAWNVVLGVVNLLVGLGYV